jgi:hypothetical protein
MTRKKIRLCFLAVSFFVISACGPEVLILGGIVGSGAGTFYYVNGEMTTDYKASFDKAWNACEKTVADMRGLDVEPKREIGVGSIRTMINGENVLINVTYKSRDVTSVGVRVGLFGNKLSSQLLHDKIFENLSSK